MSGSEQATIGLLVYETGSKFHEGALGFPPFALVGRVLSLH
jgi:hypothetical protein